MTGILYNLVESENWKEGGEEKGIGLSLIALFLLHLLVNLSKWETAKFLAWPWSYCQKVGEVSSFLKVAELESLASPGF